MAYGNVNSSEFAIERLNEAHFAFLSKFSCGIKDEDDFLKKDALGSQKLEVSETYLLFDKKRARILSYITLALGSFKLSKERKFNGLKVRNKPYDFPPSLPCMLIAKLATDKEETNKGYATYLITFAVEFSLEKRKHFSFPFLVLHAYPDKVPFYEKNGFKVAFTPAQKKPETITMYMELDTRIRRV